MALNAFASNLWEYNSPMTRAGLRLGHRMTVARLPSGGLWVHSPAKFSPSLRNEIDQLGPVEAIVAPSLFHDSFLPKWIKAYPKASLVGPSGMRKMHSGWPVKETLKGGPNTDAVPELLWPETFERVFIAGMPKVNEHVFFHRETGTLIVADLIFHFPEGSLKGWSRFAMKHLNAAYGEPVATRLFRSQIKEPDQLAKSIRAILEWNPQKIIVGHGRNITENGRAVLERAYGFLL